MSLYEGNRRLSRSEATESVLVNVTQVRQPILVIPGATMPGRVSFQVSDPGQANRAGVLFEVLRDRERTIGVQRFKVLSIGVSGGVGSNFVDTNPVIGGGSADFTGGLTLVATLLDAAVPTTVECWVDWSPVPMPSAGRMPYAMDSTIAPATVAEFGPPPAGAQYVTVFSTATPPGAAGLAASWLDAGGVAVADWNSWENAGPQVAMAGYSLALANNSGAPALVGVAWT